jgi:hypothetical protein
MLGSQAKKSFSSLTEVVFSAYKDPDCKKKLLDDKWEGLYDPKDFKLSSENIQKERIAGLGTKAKKIEYQGIQSPVLEITLILDDTIYKGTSPVFPINGITDSLEVEYDIEASLLKLGTIIQEYDGSIHRPPFVKVEYGGKEPFKGYCSKFDIQKEKFDTEGTLRLATVTLQFKGTKSIELALKEANNQSPDITHHYVVKDGDSLAAISYNTYGTTALYMELARANKLNSLRYIEPGTRLILPPLEK